MCKHVQMVHTFQLGPGLLPLPVSGPEQLDPHTPKQGYTSVGEGPLRVRGSGRRRITLVRVIHSMMGIVEPIDHLAHLYTYSFFYVYYNRVFDTEIQYVGMYMLYCTYCTA